MLLIFNVRYRKEAVFAGDQTGSAFTGPPRWSMLPNFVAAAVYCGVRFCASSDPQFTITYALNMFAAVEQRGGVREVLINEKPYLHRLNGAGRSRVRQPGRDSSTRSDFTTGMVGRRYKT